MRRILLAFVAVMALAVAACDTQPFPDARHHPRPGGGQADIHFMMDTSAWGMRQYYANVAVQINASPYVNMFVEQAGNSCTGGSDYCVVVAEDNGHACGHATNFHTTYVDGNGHTHYANVSGADALIAGNFQNCGLTLFQAQELSCHEALHVYGVGESNLSPCDNNTGLPFDSDKKLIDFLHSSGA